VHRNLDHRNANDEISTEHGEDVYAKLDKPMLNPPILEILLALL
jgi:hypothetical protein